MDRMLCFDSFKFESIQRILFDKETIGKGRKMGLLVWQYFGETGKCLYIDEPDIPSMGNMPDDKS